MVSRSSSDLEPLFSVLQPFQLSAISRKSRKHRKPLQHASYNASHEHRVQMNGVSRLRFQTAILGACLAVPLLYLWAKDFSMPKAQPAVSYPAHDHHAKENVAVALDPYDTPAKAGVFVLNYREHELLPVMLVITNDSNEPIQLSDMKAQLVTADRTKLSPASEDDIYRRISNPKASGARVPLPFPTKRVKGGVGSKEWNEIQSAQFKARAAEPLSSQAGFLFFDISGLSNPLSGARFYLTGVRDSAGHDLMYFEVPLDKYLETAKQH